MTNQGRKNLRSKSQQRPYAGSAGGNRPRPQSGQPRQVSSNYQVEMFHHHNNPHPSSSHGRVQPSGPNRFSRDQSGGKWGRNDSRKPPARKGYTNCTFELKDDLYRKFQDKLEGSSKTPKEVINQLISFYNMGKIKI